MAVNGKLDSAPETVNQSPYGEGWMLKLRPADAAAASALLDSAGYTKLVS
jgi:glycine cleavage system H protein